MEDLKLKIIELENRVQNNVLIPRTIFWSLIVAIFFSIVGNFIFTWNSVRHIQQDIEVSKEKFTNALKLLELRFDKDLEVFSRIEKKVDESITKLSDIEKQMVLKKDKKFLE